MAPYRVQFPRPVTRRIGKQYFQKVLGVVELLPESWGFPDQYVQDLDKSGFLRLSWVPSVGAGMALKRDASVRVSLPGNFLVTSVGGTENLCEPGEGGTGVSWEARPSAGPVPSGELSPEVLVSLSDGPHSLPLLHLGSHLCS